MGTPCQRLPTPPTFSIGLGGGRGPALPCIPTGACAQSCASWLAAAAAEQEELSNPLGARIRQRPAGGHVPGRWVGLWAWTIQHRVGLAYVDWAEAGGGCHASKPFTFYARIPRHRLPLAPSGGGSPNGESTSLDPAPWLKVRVRCYLKGLRSCTITLMTGQDIP